MTLLPPQTFRYLRHSQLFDKIDSFPKYVLNAFNSKKDRLHLSKTIYLTAKKTDYIFQKPSIYIYLFLD